MSAGYTPLYNALIAELAWVALDVYAGSREAAGPQADAPKTLPDLPRSVFNRRRASPMQRHYPAEFSPPA